MGWVRIIPVGWSAVLIECDHVAEVDAWRAALWRDRQAGLLTASEIIPGASTVLIDGVPDPDDLSAWLRRRRLVDIRPPGRAAQPLTDADQPSVEIPTWYDGPDLGMVARCWQMSTDAVVARHLATEFRVAFCGFAPGFAYLTGLPERLAVPRLASPRPRVPAGSVALADRYSGIYPSVSPGGWLLIGHTDRCLFDATADPPALLAPGTRVRFVPAGRTPHSGARQDGARHGGAPARRASS